VIAREHSFCPECRSHFCPHVAPHLYRPPFTRGDELERSTQAWEVDVSQDGVVAGAHAWAQFGGQVEPVLPNEEPIDPGVEAVGIADEDLERWELWLREDGAP
jgi:hypothetical protein